MKQTYDARSSEYDFKDYSFSKLNERYSVWTDNNMEDIDKKLTEDMEV